MNDHDSDTRHSFCSCDEFRERISYHIDDLDSESVAWRRHALACEACATFESNLRNVHIDLGLVRGTPVRNLWPDIAAKVASTPRRAAPVRGFVVRTAVTAAGALIMWSALALMSKRAGSQAEGKDDLARALATLWVVSTTPDELVHTDSVPEVRLLGLISDRGGDQR
jgi:hypothetical protein